ncbi:MAG: ATP-binding cassette domain-containing protein [Acidobacteriota bacterium]|nr:ATP-binding cassette domain-containing protein [Acidobacteriota bacterium]
MLIGENLTKRFGLTVALEDANCIVEPGKITAIIGPSGSGKSTLLRILALIDPADSGSVTVDSHVYRHPSIDDEMPPPWPRVTVVFQQLFLWPHLSLRENIMLPARHRAVVDAETKFENLVKAFDMRGFVDRYPNQTSLGQRQRAAIARALILEPSYILLDEVTSSLDVESIAAIVNHLRTMRTSGMGVFLITHSLSFARSSADHVLFLDQGRVLEAGGARILDAPEHPRLKQFVQLLETVR